MLISGENSEGFELSPEDEAEILARIQSAEGGDVVEGEEHLQQLRSEL